MTITWPRLEEQPQFGLGADIQTRQWVRRAWHPEDSLVTRSDLLTHAQNRIAELLGTQAPGRDQGWRPVTNSTASFTMALLDLLLHSDDLATPQIAPTPEGGLSVEWLVDGDSLSVHTGDEGLSIIAERDNGELAFPPFYWEAGTGVDDVHFVLASAARYLSKISRGVQHRLIPR